MQVEREGREEGEGDGGEGDVEEAKEALLAVEDGEVV